MSFFSSFTKKNRQFSSSDTLPFVAVSGNDKPVELRGLDIRVSVMGLFAETTQTMRFYNPNSRDLEGTLTFPLPDNAVVSGYALDVGGQMVDGVVVAKKEARRILEAEERKGVDPGLVEQVRGNVYRTRLYPIPAQGTRTVKIVYVSDLTVQGDNAAYHLPLSHAAQIDRVDLRVEVVRAPVTPEISGGPGNLTLNQWDERWVAEATLTKGAPSEDLQVRLPRLPAQFTTVEKTATGETFFCVSGKLPVEQAKWQPERIALAWDASGSAQDTSRNLRFLTELMRHWSDLTIDLEVFRQRGPEESRTFSMQNGGAGELLEYLENLPYDGGTNLSALDPSRAPHADDEAWLLFSDGLGTLEPGLPAFGALPVYTINSRADSHGAFLNLLAESTGGAYVNLLRVSADEAVSAISQGPRKTKISKVRGCEDLFITSAHGRFSVLGRLTASQGEITLSNGSDKLVIDPQNAAMHGIIARAWAGLKAQRIALREDATAKEQLLALGREYGLVTPGSSLLVLESLEQYLEYDIEPPATLAAMREEFQRRKGAQKQELKKRDRDKLETVIGWWQQRIAWWEREFRVDLQALKRRQTAGSTPIDGGTEVAGESPPAPQAAMADLSIDLADEPMEMMLAEEAKADDEMREEAAPRMAAKAAKPAAARASISIKPWSPDTPYLTAIKAAKPEQAYKTYLEQRREYAASPAFFLDCGDYFLRHEQTDIGLRILSNLVETGLDDPALMRMYAWRLQQAGQFDQAISLLERVRAERDDEPQSHRDLALALSERWQKTGRTEDATRAMELFYEVILGNWPNFPEIEIIVLMELNRLIHLAGQRDIAPPAHIDPLLIKHLDLDARISMSWDTDLTDVDLHIFEPTSEHAYYGHNLTQMGGLVSRDFTQGYGPEEYVLKKALPGKYIIKAHYFGSSQQTITGACTVIVTVFTNYGRDNENKQVLTLRLERPSDSVLVGEITIEGDAPHDWRQLFNKLERGMTIDQITAIVGQPDEISGDTEMTLVYRPAAGVIIQITMRPLLMSMRQVMDGAVVDML